MKWLSKFIFKHCWLFIILIVTGLLIAILEGIGISIVFPLLNISSNTAERNYPFPLNSFNSFFINFSYSKKLKYIAFFIFITYTLKNGLLFFSIFISAKLRKLIVDSLKIEAVSKIINVKLGYFNKKRISDYQVVADSHSEFAGGGIIFNITSGIVQLITALLLLVYIVNISWQLTLLSFAIIAIVSIVINKIQRSLVVLGEKTVKAKYKVNQSLLNILNGKKIIHIFCGENIALNKFVKNIQKYTNHMFSVDITRGSIPVLFETICFLMISVILLVGSFYISNSDTFHIETLLLFILILSRVIPPAKVLNTIIGDTLNRLPALRELVLFLDQQEKNAINTGTVKFEKLNQKIMFKNTTFQYDGKDNPAIDNMSFEVKEGQKVGIVGASGSGKSTIIDLLLGFYYPQKGDIYYNNTKLIDINLAQLRNRIGVVTQEVFLFNDSIKNNINFTNPNASQEEIVQASIQANAHDFIKNLPDGYETIVGDRGVLLSGGEKQRLSIARAILNDPEILIFDEATSSLDSESEKIVQATLDTVGKGKTVIIIAHRLFTVYNCDNIIVIENGKIIEQGNHEKLLMKNGLYKKSVSLQTLN